MKPKKQTQELQKFEPGTTDLSVAGDSTPKRCLLRTTNPDGTVVEVEAVIQQDICKITGTHSDLAAQRIFTQAIGAQSWPDLKKDGVMAIAGGLAVIEEMAPRNATEAMLANQMIAANDAALRFLNNATSENQSLHGCDANVLRATRLMRVFLEQLAAMQKLQGKAAHQKVTVEHVHVHEGGQAIVGAVNTAKTGG